MRIAAYLRLSDADSDIDKSEKEESNSITNQRALIRQYLLTHEEFKDYEYIEYIDDGISGTTTKHRPQFLHMIKSARKKKIDCIIVKDFSRFSREALVLGDYVEQVFPMIGVRFISINDHYDSVSGNSLGSAAALSVSMKALVNEYYVKDMSRKRTASVHARIKRGHSVGPVPHGYSRINGIHYEIDPEASLAIKRMYALALEGKSTYEICRILTKEGYPTPVQYALNHPGEKHVIKHSNHDYSTWGYSSVFAMLRNPVYTGSLIMGKSKFADGKTKKRIPTSKDEYHITPNAHPAIISQELFNQVQAQLEKRKVPTKNPANYSNHQIYGRKPDVLYRKKLSGHLQCGYCGKLLTFSQGGYQCKCPSNYLKTASLCQAPSYMIAPIEDAVFTEVITLCTHIVGKEKEYQALYQSNRIKIKDLKYRIAHLEHEEERLKEKKASNYEQLVNHEISLQQYQMHELSIARSLGQIQSQLTESIESKENLSSFHVPIELEMLAENVAPFVDQKELTPEMVKELIIQIKVDDRSPLEIKWKHISLLIETGICTDAITLCAYTPAPKKNHK